jgi:hypothetical protein
MAVNSFLADFPVPKYVSEGKHVISAGYIISHAFTLCVLYDNADIFPISPFSCFIPETARRISTELNVEVCAKNCCDNFF